ncbi:hypothetical protein AVEN_165100-1 [Araneus ventricosus]|uniref:Uncharacterized protein n=1 Tax=Araneus ventricosus TaxID=182803 RepID=A0A4Y2UJJ0_ARAVE|nr:hypothetical protein AVEN_121736-1 [Araneus ventricosus]GBO12282.1 hypothetical protein AVEN_163807-1 [Araneus ventricosus]GBO12294.1 hypothetical protein AVEN_258357-1 [Araneus ventricosus]GBO12301.1 hypothetical protein AVEN_165100-1 [Araneus ventricosus]
MMRTDEVEQTIMKRCVQIRYFEYFLTAIKKCATILSTNRNLCQILPEPYPKSRFLQIHKEHSLLQAAMEQKVSEFGNCPIDNCIYHSSIYSNSKIISKRNRSFSKNSDVPNGVK